MIINPHTGKFIRTNGLVDTGASECAIPAVFSNMLGHNFNAGILKHNSTGNGMAECYGHTSTIIIYHPQQPNNKILYTINNVIIDCMPNLPVVLLGVNGFLSNFILSIDYPKRIFSIIK
jgi:hypothetical protein